MPSDDGPSQRRHVRLGLLPFALDSLLKVFQQCGHEENVSFIVAHQLLCVMSNCVCLHSHTSVSGQQRALLFCI